MLKAIAAGVLLELAEMVETFRLKKAVKYQGILFTAIFAAALIGWTSAILFVKDFPEPDNLGEYSVLIKRALGLVVLGPMLLMSIYIWMAYYVEQFTIAGTNLTIRSMLQNRQFDVSVLEGLKWRIWPVGGSIAFRAGGSTAVLGLHGYEIDDRLRIIRALYDLVPASHQQGWPEFCNMIALPLREDPTPAVQSDPSGEYFTVTRKRYDRMAAIGIPLALLVAVAFGWALNVWQFFVFPFFVTGVWLMMRYNVPSKGHSEKHLSMATAEGRAMIIGMSSMPGMVLLMGGTILAVRWCGFDKSIAGGSACVVCAIAFLPVLYLFHTADKQKQSAQKQAVLSAPEQWRQAYYGAADTEKPTPDRT